MDKLIYLDIDILINGDLDLLWNINFGNHTIEICFASYLAYEILKSNHLIVVNVCTFKYNR
ncbi:glycosyltransferase [Psittacicella hinzii]|uniref:Uncharacterized protein n=1 Tax=Psittacicella hinzii TaxID=2028575 RepID=A0A3A1YKA6_9GAMM|nr:hypothetical protein CKF58_04530 [Psittacicella hinzii]